MRGDAKHDAFSQGKVIELFEYAASAPIRSGFPDDPSKYPMYRPECFGRLRIDQREAAQVLSEESGNPVTS